MFPFRCILMPGQDGYTGAILLTALIAFVAEHRRCGELEGGVNDGYVWMTYSCGAEIAHRLPSVSQKGT